MTSFSRDAQGFNCGRVWFGWTQIKAIARGVYVYSYRVIAAKIATVAAWNWAVGAVIGVSAGAAIYTMGNFRLFY